MSSLSIYFLSFFGGVLPAILWLTFWLKEDKIKPEPKRAILVAFVFGMISVIVALFLENLTGQFFDNLISPIKEIDPRVFGWAGIEEFLKMAAFVLVIFSTRLIDEPIDLFVYAVTVALGFAALENAIFLGKSIFESGAIEAVKNQGLRFIGASLLHVITSGALGIALGLSFYENKFIRVVHFFCGFLIAIFLHVLFNTLILLGEIKNVFTAFSLVWISALVLLLLCEKLKHLGRTN